MKFLLLLGFFYLFMSLRCLILLLKLKVLCYLTFDNFSIYSFDLFQIAFLFDYYSLIYLFVLFLIVGRVHFFIIEYMGSDINIIRFTIILNLFVASMVILVLSPTLIFFILGWDGLGFSSFVLVSWYSCDVRRSSSLKTFLVNRLGDAFLLCSLVMIFCQGHFGFLVWDNYVNFLILILLIVSFTKRAQFPFRRWLPDAMAAPTPVSSLVHSSTLVTAGLYFIFRFSYDLTLNYVFMLHNFGLWTMLIGSLGGCFDYNSKKVVAYSTVSQLGFMCFVLSYGYFDYCFFYIMVHALFKALLFISVGRTIKSNFHFQDIRQLRGVTSYHPFSSFKIFFSLVSLSGLPFFSGFWIKELVLKGYCFYSVHYFSLFLGVISFLFTATYSFRLFYILKFGTAKNLKINKNNRYSFFSVIFLYFGVLFVGLCFRSTKIIWFYFFSSLKIIALIVFVGIFSFSYINGIGIYGRLYNYLKYFYQMFYLKYITYSFGIIYVLGQYLNYVFDKGIVIFSFIKYLDQILRQIWNKVINHLFFYNWLFITGFLILLVFISLIFGL